MDTFQYLSLYQINCFLLILVVKNFLIHPLKLLFYDLICQNELPSNRCIVCEHVKGLYYDIDRLGSIHEVDRANISEEYNNIDRVMYRRTVVKAIITIIKWLIKSLRLVGSPTKASCVISISDSFSNANFKLNSPISLSDGLTGYLAGT